MGGSGEAVAGVGVQAAGGEGDRGGSGQGPPACGAASERASRAREPHTPLGVAESATEQAAAEEVCATHTHRPALSLARRATTASRAVMLPITACDVAHHSL